MHDSQMRKENGGDGVEEMEDGRQDLLRVSGYGWMGLIKAWMGLVEVCWGLLGPTLGLDGAY